MQELSRCWAESVESASHMHCCQVSCTRRVAAKTDPHSGARLNFQSQGIKIIRDHKETGVWGLPWWGSVVKNLSANAGVTGVIPDLR